MERIGHGEANYGVVYPGPGREPLGLRCRDLDRPYSSWVLLDDGGSWGSRELSVFEAARIHPVLRSEIRIATDAEITRLRETGDVAADRAANRLFGEFEIEQAASGRIHIANPWELADLFRTRVQRADDGSHRLRAVVGGHRPSAPQIETIAAILSDIRNRWDAMATFVVEAASDYETSYVQGIVADGEFYAEAVDHDSHGKTPLTPGARRSLLRQGWEDPKGDPTFEHFARTDNLVREGTLATESDARELSHQLAISLAVGYGVNPSAELLVSVFRSEVE